MQVEKAACKNVGNILRAPFLYESLFGSFSLVTFWLWWKYENIYLRKMLEYNVDEIDTCNVLIA